MKLLLLILSITLNNIALAIPLVSPTQPVSTQHSRQTHTPKTSPEPANTPDGFGLMASPATCGGWGAPCTEATLHRDCCPPIDGDLRAVCTRMSNTCDYVKKQNGAGGCAQDKFGVMGGVCG
jgi:hypothetical protein